MLDFVPQQDLNIIEIPKMTVGFSMDRKIPNQNAKARTGPVGCSGGPNGKGAWRWRPPPLPLLARSNHFCFGHFRTDGFSLF